MLFIYKLLKVHNVVKVSGSALKIKQLCGHSQIR